MSNTLLIAGCGRNVGKTSAGCALIEELSQRTKIIAVKVSSHFHSLAESQEVIHEENNLMIAEETDALSGKDSSRYLAAGAVKVYYVQAGEASLPVLVEWMKQNISPKQPVVIESGGLGRYIHPGAAVLICNGKELKKADWSFDYIQMEGSQPSKVRLPFKWEKSRWQRR